MGRYVQIGSEVIDQFPVFDEDGYSKVSGVVDFDPTIWKDGVEQAVTPTITEIDSSGEYKISFTPDAVGVWVAEVLIPLNKQIWGNQYNVHLGSEEDGEMRFSMADDGNHITMLCWLEVDGQRVTTLTEVAAQIKDKDGLVKDLGTNDSPDADGVFSFVSDSDLTTHHAYFISVQGTDGSRTWYANKGFATG